MNIRIRNWLPASLLVFASIPAALSQPVIGNITLSGQPQNAADANHPYAAFSTSVGANLNLKVTASGTAPISYQWQFNQENLSGQTKATLPLTDIQVTNAGNYTVIVIDATGTATNQVTLSVDTTFTKVTTGGIVTTEDLGVTGGTWADYDNDGYLDLLTYNAVSEVPKLYHNNAGLSFTLVSTGAPNAAADGSSACWGDYDNDGYVDLYVTTSTENQLYHNNGNSTFTRVLNAGPVVTDNANTLASSWADFNNDGFIDMFATTFDPNAHSHCYLYKNNGDGTFASVTNSALVTGLASSVAAAWADYDNDGHIDVIISGGRGTPGPKAPNRLYHNNGDGSFTQVTTGAIVTDLGYSGAFSWGDYDNDGYPDLFVGNIGGVTNFLYHNNGDGTFTRVTNDIVAQDVPTFGGSAGCAWGDYDNDGFLDLFVSNFSANGLPTAVNYLYHNNGDGTFTKITNGSPVNEFSDTSGCAWVDYDNDGFLDLFVGSNHGQGNYLYHNNGNSNAWLTVRLVGTASNRSAVGAKVRAKAFYRGQSRWQLRQIFTGSGYNGHDELQANFGLGEATNVDTLRIEWPSGIVQELTNIVPRQILTITEPAQLSVSVSNGAPQFTLKSWRGLQYDVQSSTDLANWSLLESLIVTNSNGLTQIVDTNGASATEMFYRAVSR